MRRSKGRTATVPLAFSREVKMQRRKVLLCVGQSLRKGLQEVDSYRITSAATTVFKRSIVWRSTGAQILIALTIAVKLSKTESWSATAARHGIAGSNGRRVTSRYSSLPITKGHLPS